MYTSLYLDPGAQVPMANNFGLNVFIKYMHTMLPGRARKHRLVAANKLLTQELPRIYQIIPV